MMTIGFLFWLLMIIWLIFGFVTHASVPSAGSGWPAYWPIGAHLLVFILFLLLGIQVFGWPIKA